MRFIDEKRKNLFRAYVAQAASVLEIAIAVLVLAAILITGVRAAGEVFGLFFAENSSQAFTTVLEHAFNLIIGVEFIKMLAKHTPGSAIEVLLFAIARPDGDRAYHTRGKSGGHCHYCTYFYYPQVFVRALVRHTCAGDRGCAGGHGRKNGGSF